MFFHYILFPVLWLNSLLGNQVWSDLAVLLGQGLFWVSLFSASAIFLTRYHKLGWPYILVACLILARVGSTFLPELYVVYQIHLAIVYVLAGIVIAEKRSGILPSQLAWFCLLSLPVMFIQVAGWVPGFQVFNTLYIQEATTLMPQIEMLPTLFVSEDYLMKYYYEEFYSFLSMQSRPPGLTHSSAMFAVFILAFAAFQFARSGLKLSFWDHVVVVVAVLSGAKLAVWGVIVLITVGYTRTRTRSLLKMMYLLGFFALTIWTYYKVFPAPSVHNLSMDSIETSLYPRIADALLYLAPAVANIDWMKEYMEVLNIEVWNEGEFGVLSGLGRLVQILPFALLLAVLLLPYIYRLIRRNADNIDRGSVFMMIVVVMIPFATPLFASPFYWLCCGTALAAFLPGLFPRFFSVGSRTE